VIFVTVGSQEPFDRLIRGVDEWARTRIRSDVFAQIASSNYQPQHIRYTRFVEPAEFNRVIREASVIVAHAGMGSIISALELGKRIVVMPRRANLRETRNDHQVATAERFGAQGNIIVANDESELAVKIDYAITLGSGDRIDAQASPRLLAIIRAFLDGNLQNGDPGDTGQRSKAKTDKAKRTGSGANVDTGAVQTNL
jgi:UDP-N-acetylglucosamine transferase subunit ALG13